MKNKITIIDEIRYYSNWIKMFFGASIVYLGLKICGIKKISDNYIEQINNIFK